MAGKTLISPLSDPNRDPKTHNKAILAELYNSLARGETETVTRLLTADLEWWFHGPPHCQHMMRVLTGESLPGDFKFQPRSITAIDDRVIAEGWEGTQAYWVHVWTLKDGLITQFREYFNTWLTVRDLRPPGWQVGLRPASPTLWQSHAMNLSLPGLVLAI